MLVVQKYGGTSVDSPEKIKQVARRIVQTKLLNTAALGTVAPGSEPSVVVVVSAMGHTTDDLIALAQQVSEKNHERELDMLLSAGERISMALLTMALRDLGYEAISLTGSQSGIITDENHNSARILEIKPYRIQKELEQGRIVIVAGFQGISREKEITTLGRGGSDTTAVALAAALSADRCEIYTDVAGIFSADPHVVSDAYRYEKLPLETVLEMAVNGAQVMHPSSINIAIEKKLSLFVGHAQTGIGTVLPPQPFDDTFHLPQITAVTAKRNLQEIPKSFFIGSYPGFTMALVSVIGHQIQKSSHIKELITETLQQAGVTVLGLTSSDQSITVLVSNHKADAAVRSLHQRFFGEKIDTSKYLTT